MGSLCLNKHLWKVGLVFECFPLLETETGAFGISLPCPLVNFLFTPSCILPACHHFIFYGTYKLAFVPAILSSLLIMGMILVPSLLNGLSIRFEIPRRAGATLWNSRRAEGMPLLSWNVCSFFSEVHIVETEELFPLSDRARFILTKCFALSKEAFPVAFYNEQSKFQREVVCVWFFWCHLSTEGINMF